MAENVHNQHRDREDNKIEGERTLSSRNVYFFHYKSKLTIR